MTARSVPWVLRIASLLVPSSGREEWIEEWHGELLAWHERSQENGTSGMRRRWLLWWHMFGAVPDALNLFRSRFTLRRLAMTGAMLELRLALRSLLRRPGFTSVAVVTLALGIGANTALFSVVNTVLLEPFPYPDPGRLVRFVGHSVGEAPDRGPLAYPNAYDMREQATRFEGIALYDEWEAAVVGVGVPEVLAGAQISWNFFDVLGVSPEVGRFFRADEEGPGREPAVVLSHRLWTRKFGADPEIVGQSIQLNGASFLVLGVVEAGFEDPKLSSLAWGEPDVWKTVNFPRDDMPRGGQAWTALGRISPDETLESAAEEVALLMDRLRAEYPDDNANDDISIRSLQESVVGDSRRALAVLLGAVGLVLLIACANLASLLLSRGLDRSRETSIQRALGASRARVVGRVLLESLLLSMAGAGTGILLAIVATSRIVAFAGNAIPRADRIVVDGPVLAFTLVLAVVAGLVFGALPAWVLSREKASHAAELRSQRGSGSGPKGARLRRGLILGELALSTVLLVCAGLLMKSFWRLGQVDLGVNVEAVTVAGIHGSTFWDVTPAEAEQRYRDLYRTLLADPAVESVGAIDIVPLTGSFSCDGVRRSDLPPPEPGQGVCAEVRGVSGDVFEAFGVELLAGRFLEMEEVDDETPELVLSVGLADRFWPGESPLRQSLYVHGEDYVVVGVVEEVANFGPGNPTAPQVYIPALQDDWNGYYRGLSLIVRARADAPIPPARLRADLVAADPDLPLNEVTTLSNLAWAIVNGPRFRAALLGAFAALALLLAAIGIVGVVGYSVRTRTREMGVRLAHGATGFDLRRMILGEGMRLLLPGIGLGLVGAWFAGRTLSSLLFDVRVWDPTIALAATLTLGMAVTLGCVLPARRAASIQPVEALRME